MSKFSRLAFAALALLAAPLSATAADLTPRYKAPAYVAPSYATWSGFYAGLQAGYGFGTSSWDLGVSNSPKGFVGGGTIGYNLQTGAWVWGLEADGSYSAIKGDTACGPDTCETRNSWLGTARGRIGYGGLGNLLPYLTGGAAFGSVKASNSGFGSASNTRFGWTVGAGLEYMMWSNWSVKGEYLYVDLGKFDCGLSCGPVTPDNVSFKAHIIRAGLNYHF